MKNNKLVEKGGELERKRSAVTDDNSSPYLRLGDYPTHA